MRNMFVCTCMYMCIYIHIHIHIYIYIYIHIHIHIHIYIYICVIICIRTNTHAYNSPTCVYTHAFNDIGHKIIKSELIFHHIVEYSVLKISIHRVYFGPPISFWWVPGRSLVGPSFPTHPADLELPNVLASTAKLARSILPVNRVWMEKM